MGSLQINLYMFYFLCILENMLVVLSFSKETNLTRKVTQAHIIEGF
jgi:hypothetical protein